MAPTPTKDNSSKRDALKPPVPRSARGSSSATARAPAAAAAAAGASLRPVKERFDRLFYTSPLPRSITRIYNASQQPSSLRRSVGVDGPKTASTGTATTTRQKNPPPSARKQVEKQANFNAESLPVPPRVVVNNVPSEPVVEMHQQDEQGGASGSQRRQQVPGTPSRPRRTTVSSSLANPSPEKPQRVQVVTKQVARKPALRLPAPNKAAKTRSGVGATTSSVKKAMPVKKATPVTRAQKATTTAAAAASTPAPVAPRSPPLHPPTLSPVPKVDSPLPPTPAKPKSKPKPIHSHSPPRRNNLGKFPPGILDQTGSFWSRGRRLSRRSLGNFTLPPLAAPSTIRRRFSAGHENSLGKKPPQPKPSTKRKSTDLHSSVQGKGKEQEQNSAKKAKIANPEGAKTPTKTTRQSSKVAAKQVVQKVVDSVFYFSDDD